MSEAVGMRRPLYSPLRELGARTRRAAPDIPNRDLCSTVSPRTIDLHQIILGRLLTILFGSVGMTKAVTVSFQALVDTWYVAKNPRRASEGEESWQRRHPNIRCTFTQ